MVSYSTSINRVVFQLGYFSGEIHDEAVAGPRAPRCPTLAFARQHSIYTAHVRKCSIIDNSHFPFCVVLQLCTTVVVKSCPLYKYTIDCIAVARTTPRRGNRVKRPVNNFLEHIYVPPALCQAQRRVFLLVSRTPGYVVAVVFTL